MPHVMPEMRLGAALWQTQSVKVAQTDSLQNISEPTSGAGGTFIKIYLRRIKNKRKKNNKDIGVVLHDEAGNTPEDTATSG